VAGSTVYVGNGGTVYALDAGTGGLRWSHAAAGVLAAPAVVGNTVYIGNDAGMVYALSAATGHLDWAHDTSGAVNSSPAAVGGTVYIATADGKVFALSAATGHLDWSYGGKGNGLPVNFGLTAAGSTVYVSYTSTTAHELYALSAATGHLDWSYDTGDTVYSRPVVAGSAVYIGNIDGTVDALNIGAG
jgi:serine/threonine-protein kinase